MTVSIWFVFAPYEHFWHARMKIAREHKSISSWLGQRPSRTNGKNLQARTSLKDPVLSCPLNDWVACSFCSCTQPMCPSLWNRFNDKSNDPRLGWCRRVCHKTILARMPLNHPGQCLQTCFMSKNEYWHCQMPTVLLHVTKKLHQVISSSRVNYIFDHDAAPWQLVELLAKMEA